MFIWNWIAIAFGWLVFLLLILFIVALFLAIVNVIKNGR